MTTSSFGTPLAPAPAPFATTGEVQAAQISRRNVIALAIVAAALVLGAGVYLLLFAGGDEADVVAAPPVVKAPAAAAPAVPAVVPTPVVRQKAVKARNPFTALVVQEQPAPVGAGAPAGVTPPLPVTPVSGTPVTRVPTSVPITSMPITSVPITSVPITSVPITSVPITSVPTTVVRAVPVPPVAAPRPAPVTVKLGAVSDDNTVALLTVAGKAVRVRAGAEFGTNYRVLNLRDGSCGAVQLGNVVVDLCEGTSYTAR